jgi:hypothetical protein
MRAVDGFILSRKIEDPTPYRKTTLGVCALAQHHLKQIEATNSTISHRNVLGQVDLRPHAEQRPFGTEDAGSQKE